MKLTWVTDIHLDFLEVEARTEFYQKIIASGGDAVLITGDIANSKSVSEILKEMACGIHKPIYFVLGNHDYYGGAVATVREEMYHLTRNDPFLHYLPLRETYCLDSQTILLGADCWADGRYGNYRDTDVVMNDSRMIADLRLEAFLGQWKLLKKMQELADEDAEQLKIRLHEAIKRYNPKKVIIGVHVPPLEEVCLYGFKRSHKYYLPFYASKVTGEMLMEIAETYKEIEFLVLCGHTHSAASYRARKNLLVKAGEVEYGHPSIQRVIVLDELPFTEDELLEDMTPQNAHSELIESPLDKEYTLQDKDD